MAHLVRFGVSLEKTLLTQFDQLCKGRSYTNRSEALRDLIRKELISKQWETDGEGAGAITVIFDHHRKDLVTRLTDIQHDFQEIIISTQHVHLDHYHCLEIIAVRGKPRLMQKLADTLCAVKGVEHGVLSMTGISKKESEHT